MQPFKLCFLFCSIFILSSCGTIFWGSKKRIYFNTYPSGADVYVNHQPMNCVTPCSLLLDRKGFHPNRKTYRITYKKEGFEDGETDIHRNINWAPLVLNCCLGGYFSALSIPFDIATGSIYDWSTAQPVNLEKKAEPSATQMNDKEPATLDTKNQVKEPAKMASEFPATYVFERKSDVDTLSTHVNPIKSHRIALIIGNEDYHSFQEGLSAESDVKYARNDASAFRAYSLHYLGIPEERIIFSLNATSGRMKQNIAKLNLLIKNLNGEAEVFIYYAGHGFPDEVTKEPYLIPVDVSGVNPTEGGVSLKDFYQKINEFPSQKITVFLDACFSGGARNQGLLATRGVRIKANEATMTGNMLVLAACGSEQAALPFSNKYHGIFTYFLLKKIKETNGNLSYKDLFDYVHKKVSLESVSYNDKEQNPQINISPDLENKWENLPLILK
jgi:hypothetical protein